MFFDIFLLKGLKEIQSEVLHLLSENAGRKGLLTQQTCLNGDVPPTMTDKTKSNKASFFFHGA